jgi:hypothetical protein
MPARTVALAALFAAYAGWSAAQTLPPPPILTESPWDGDWVLSPSRNTPEVKAAAADGYRFRLDSGGHIRWEIPSLGEVVEGRTDGAPMAINRGGKTTRLTLSVTAQGPWNLSYKVSRDGRPSGEGRMILIEQGNAWVDISGPPDRPDLADVVIYVRPGAAKA